MNTIGEYHWLERSGGTFLQLSDFVSIFPFTNKININEG